MKYPAPKIPRSYTPSCMYPISSFQQINLANCKFQGSGTSTSKKNKCVCLKWNSYVQRGDFEGEANHGHENGKKNVELRKEKDALSLKERGGRMTVPFF